MVRMCLIKQALAEHEHIGTARYHEHKDDILNTAMAVYNTITPLLRSGNVGSGCPPFFYKTIMDTSKTIRDIEGLKHHVDKLETAARKHLIKKYIDHTNDNTMQLPKRVPTLKAFKNKRNEASDTILPIVCDAYVFFRKNNHDE